MSNFSSDSTGQQLSIAEEIRSNNSKYKNVYWYSRLLIDSEYGSKGGDIPTMNQLIDVLRICLDDEDLEMQSAKNIMAEFFQGLHKPDTSIAHKSMLLGEELSILIEDKNDLKILLFTIEHIVIPTDLLLSKVPSNDREFAERLIRLYLSEKGELGLKNVIEKWDKYGTRGSLEEERIYIVAGFKLLRIMLDELISSNQITQLDSDITLTAFIQEFERRLVRGVRPQRAGRSLEDVTGVILDHFDIQEYDDVPAHVKTVFETDKMINLPDGWNIGVSCKRTLRERWKQAATLNSEILDEHNIRSTWHLITHTGDLSAQIVKAIGESRGVLYLPDDSRFYQENRNNIEINDLIKPMSSFIKDIKIMLYAESG